MNESLFHFETVETPARCVKIRFEKTFSARGAAGAAADPLLVFEDFVNKHLAKGYLHFHLDLRNLPFPGTRFIALLIALTVRARRRGGEITLSHVTDTARNNFVIFSALSYLTLAPELDPLNETARMEMPARQNAPTPAPSQKRTTSAGAKSAPVRKPLPNAASAHQVVSQPHVVDLPAPALAANKDDGLPVAVPLASSHQTGKNLPLENAVLTEDAVALADIVDPPLVKEIARKIEAPLAPAAAQNFQIRVESRVSNLYQLCDFVTVHAVKAGISEKEISKIKVAVYEACLNVIEHAYHSRPDEWIELEVGYSPDKFTIVITDHGLSFEMKPPTAYDVQEVMDKRRSGGFGLHIIRRSMDSVEYHPDLVNGNRLIMVKHLK
ncbi:ATP-binding protein [candidate division KSB1 bacterium]|nr:ATP-binding protein [candidate division KSB1 bacterium]